MKTENLSTLKIHKLSQEQYNREFDAGNIDPNAIYLTPWEASSGGPKGGGFVAQDSAPEDTSLLWIDTADVNEDESEEEVDLSVFIKTVNGAAPDENGNVEIDIPKSEPLIVNLSADGTTDKHVIEMVTAWAENRQVIASLGEDVIALTGLRGNSAFFSGTVNAKEIAVVVTGNTYEITETNLATERYVTNYAQPKGNYLTAVPDGYAKTKDIPTDDHINELIDDKLADLPGSSADASWKEIANYTTTEDVSVLEFKGLSCKEFVMLVKGRVNDATDSLGNGNATTFTYVNNISHGGAATAFFVRPSGASFPVIYHVQVLGGVIEQSASRKGSGSNMGNLQVSERIVEAEEIQSIRVIFGTAGHLLKTGATVKVWVR